MNDAAEDRITKLADRFDREAERTITLRAGELGDLVQKAAAALQRAGVPIYSRGGEIYRSARLEVAEAGPVRRPVGALILRPVDAEWLRLQMAEAALWQRYDARARKHVPTDPPAALARLVLADADRHGWPVLRGITQCPVLTESGDLVTEGGYHAASGLLLNLGEDWPTPPAPTRDAAVAARETLAHLIRHFPFASDADRAVALSMLVTACTRGTLSTAPLHAVDAPEAGTGKSLLVDCAAILATGRTAAVVEYGREAAEAGKRLDAALLAGDAFVAIDNVEAPLEGAALCQTLTQTARKVRILGESKAPTVPCTVTITANGNNLTIRGDLVRRALVARLDAQTERPELRRFDQDLLTEATSRRVELATAALTIPRAYIVAGRPDLKLSPLGSFEDWSRTVRAALVWAGAADPCQTMTRTRTSDPHRQAAAAVLTAWRESFGTEGATAAEAIAKAPSRAHLADALAEVCANRGALDPRRLGSWLRRHRDTRAGGLVLRHCGSRQGAVVWTVENRESRESRESDLTHTREDVREEVTYIRETPGADSSDSSDSPDSPADRIEAAARQAGISADLLRDSLAPDDLDDPQLDLHQHAAWLARDLSSRHATATGAP